MRLGNSTAASHHRICLFTSHTLQNTITILGSQGYTTMTSQDHLPSNIQTPTTKPEGARNITGSNGKTLTHQPMGTAEDADQENKSVVGGRLPKGKWVTDVSTAIHMIREHPDPNPNHLRGFETNRLTQVIRRTATGNRGDISRSIILDSPFKWLRQGRLAAITNMTILTITSLVWLWIKGMGTHQRHREVTEIHRTPQTIHNMATLLCVMPTLSTLMIPFNLAPQDPQTGHRAFFQDRRPRSDRKLVSRKIKSA